MRGQTKVPRGQWHFIRNTCIYLSEKRQLTSKKVRWGPTVLFWKCLSYSSVAIINHSWPKQPIKRRVFLGLWLQRVSKGGLKVKPQAAGTAAESSHHIYKLEAQSTWRWLGWVFCYFKGCPQWYTSSNKTRPPNNSPIVPLTGEQVVKPMSLQ